MQPVGTEMPPTLYVLMDVPQAQRYSARTRYLMVGVAVLQRRGSPQEGLFQTSKKASPWSGSLLALSDESNGADKSRGDRSKPRKQSRS